MSGKRFDILYYATPMNEMSPVILDNESGVTFESEEAARQLNDRAETIKVLREWLDEIGLWSSLIYVEKMRAENTNGDYPPKIVENARRRLTALEG